ncbi:hypothetical protein JTB14_021337 [Gonioctena quinquepunctata]|nr:hypothetical protein JTB14_021337 [Gonioctena quinquepunctata]
MFDSKIEGEYVLYRNEGFYEYLVAQGISEEKAKEANLMQPILKVSIDNEDITFLTNIGPISISSVLKIDHEVDETIALNITMRSFTELDDNRIIISSKGPNGEMGKRSFEFSTTSMTMILSSDKPNIPEARRYYKRK